MVQLPIYEDTINVVGKLGMKWHPLCPCQMLRDAEEFFPLIFTDLTAKILKQSKQSANQNLAEPSRFAVSDGAPYEIT